MPEPSELRGAREPRAAGRRVGFRVAAVLLTLGALLGVTEIALRVQLHFKRVRKGNTAPEPMEPHEVRGWCSTPLHTFDAPDWTDFSGAQYALHYTSNARGFRGTGAVAGAVAATGRKRLFVVGDSFTQALDASDDKTYFARLQAPLGIEVQAYGCCGYGTLQELLVLQEYVGQVKPDAVLLQLCYNDFIDNDYELERTNSWNNQGKRRPYLADDGTIFYAVPRPFAWIRTDLQPNVAVVDFVVSRIDRLRADRESSSETAVETQGPTHPGFVHSCRITGEILRRFRAAAGAVPVFAFDVSGRQPWESAFRTLTRDAGIELLEGVAAHVRAAEERNVVCRGRDAQHWNEEGHRQVAEALVERLRATWLRN